MEPRTTSEPVNSSVPANAAALAAPRVIGLYGLPGCGKSYIMDQLKQELGETDFEFFEGSKEISKVAPDGLDKFKELDEYQQDHWRKYAIDAIKSACAQTGKTGIVTGHYMFWDDEKKEQASRVCSQADLATYTHILYVNAPLEVTAKQRAEDTKRARLNVSIQHLRRWQETEIQEIHNLCRENNILFATIYPNLKSKLASLIRDFQCHDENHNRFVAEQIFDKYISPSYDELQTVLFFDADKTLAAVDTGTRFWKIHETKGGKKGSVERAVPRAVGESTNDDEFEAICEEIASHTRLYPGMSLLLRQAERYRHVCSVIVTCGLHRVWQKIIEKAGLSHVVKVVGGGRLKDGFVVTPSVKECLITRAASVHAAYTWAFGDSPLDLPMMRAARKPIVVVGEQQSRSKSMKLKLLTEIKDNGLQARQVLLPNNTSPPLLDTTRLPVANLTEKSFLDEIFQPHGRPGGIRLHHATDSHTAKLLSTPMRDDSIRGPSLQEAHENAGRYLATQYLVELIGTEELTIRHPQGNVIAGYQLLDEERTLIVPLMRGGQPMASGIFNVFPKARFHDVKEPTDFKKEYIEGIVTVILVDSVINSGKSVAQFVQRIREMDGSVRIIIVAGVIQDQAVRGRSQLRAVARSTELTVVALRLSANKYTGKGTTDTGNRLFNTTYLD
ncbi:uracil phosphoribosyltransferase-domain-containing protein [Aspergillus foveolatus]|uniref:uracil phosphoribosyltransferase-domain-containing protein n=1 Tax=Aspergillus foveolatus TaxID=210207 RepID=UPI003CCD3B2C